MCNKQTIELEVSIVHIIIIIDIQLFYIFLNNILYYIILFSCFPIRFPIISVEKSNLFKIII